MRPWELVAEYPVDKNGINSQMMYGRCTRNEMFYNLARYSNQLNLLSLDNHQLFETQNQNMAWITVKREAHLKQAATRCREHLAKGNIVTDFQAITTNCQLRLHHSLGEFFGYFVLTQ